jgi:rhamnulokinase
MVEKACDIVPREEIFAQTGLQFMQINSLYQLFAMAQQQSPALEIAQDLLFMPDLFHYWFTGQKTNEYTIASTSQCYNMRENKWSATLLEMLGIPTHIFKDAIQPGSNLGPLLPSVTEELGFSQEIDVIVPGCHDTASAVAAVPVSAGDAESFAYLSSGTWSLMGVEIPQPIVDDKSLAYNFTNEGGVENTIRLLKNIMGLWLVQESRRTWAAEGDVLSYDDITRLAKEAAPFTAIIDPDDVSFLSPGDMPTRIREYCQRTGQIPPESQGAVVRCALESLALRYRWVVERLEEMTGRTLNVIHIVGGGSQNRLLNQFTADVTGRRVVAGPIEATAIGSVLMQMLALGHISSLSEGRELVRRSFPAQTYNPTDTDAWANAYKQFESLVEA